MAHRNDFGQTQEAVTHGTRFRLLVRPLQRRSPQSQGPHQLPAQWQAGWPDERLLLSDRRQ